ncbi:MAG: hypothetical protein AAF378_14430 [Cyanobacteria bacterium P01_A01_bin.84]
MPDFDIFTTPEFQNFLSQLGHGEINVITGIAWFIITAILAVIGGAIGGMILAGKDLGYQFSALLGGIFGTSGVIPAVVAWLVFLNYFS